MKLRAYCIYDVKVQTYFPPFFAPGDGSACRSLSDLVNDLNTTVGRHPRDFSLFFVGEFDDSKGSLTPVSPVIHVTDAISFAVDKDIELDLDLKSRKGEK